MVKASNEAQSALVNSHDLPSLCVQIRDDRRKLKKPLSLSLCSRYREALSGEPVRASNLSARTFCEFGSSALEKLDVYSLGTIYVLSLKFSVENVLCSRVTSVSEIYIL